MSKRWRRLGAVLAAAAIALVTVASTGEAAKSEPGGTLSAAGTLTTKNGDTFFFSLTAEESTQPGVGSMTLEFGGAGISACDVHGPGADPGSLPYPDIQCTGSFGQNVVVDDCKAVLEAHGFVHSDHPFTTYLGSTVIDIEFKYDPKKSTSNVRIDIYTPKDAIRIEGTTSASVAMPTCT